AVVACAAPRRSTARVSVRGSPAAARAPAARAADGGRSAWSRGPHGRKTRWRAAPPVRQQRGHEHGTTTTHFLGGADVAPRPPSSAQRDALCANPTGAHGRERKRGQAGRCCSGMLCGHRLPLLSRLLSRRRRKRREERRRGGEEAEEEE
ncbi:unnamed protein product, partial [Prorocentrum cordatum]